MKITIEADTKGETMDRQVFEHVTQFVLGGWRRRQGILLGTFTQLHVNNFNEMIGMATTLKEYLRDHKKERQDAGSVS